MDFVVVGLGVGALTVLLGLIIRDGGGRWWSIGGDRSLPPAEADRRLAIRRACRAGGLVLGVAGAVILAVTAIALVFGVSDRVGAMLVMAAVTATVLSGVAWALLYAHRYHPRPQSRIVSRRHQRRIDRPEHEAPSLAGTIDAGVARLGTAAGVDELDLPTTEPASADEPAVALEAPATTEPDPSGIDATAPDAPAPTVDAVAPAIEVPVRAEPSPETDPAPSDEPPADAAPTRTPTYATGVNRES